MTKLKSIKSEYYLIAFILLIGTILRFWNFSEIPFTHDEFSALKRLHFHSFEELINKGVKLDAHPAGVHVFMYYWIKIFGELEIMVKLPFILMGIGSIWLIYIVGKLWFNATVGLVTAAFLSTLQYPIMYSQIARPYISGLFLSLLMVWYWSHLMKNPKNKFWKNYIGFILFTALCAYNHHFSLLLAAVVGITGIFTINKKYLLKYIFAGLAIFLLYIPHLPIFFYQLNIGGVEAWLSKPTPLFIVDFIQYVFHFSWYVLLLALGILFLGILKIKSKPFNKYTLISLLWFITPFLIGYFYSVYENAVLQYSVLIFSFPYLLFVLFGFMPDLHSKKQFLLVGAICLVAVSSLVIERQHYKIFYQNRFKQILVDTKNNIDQLGESNCTVLLSNHSEINNYYAKHLQLNFSYFNTIQSGKDVDLEILNKVENYVKNASTPYFIYGGVAYGQNEIYSIVKEYFPNLVKKYNYAGSNLYLFDKNGSSNDEYSFTFLNDFELSQPEWNYSLTKKTDSISFHGNCSYQFDPNDEFGSVFEYEFENAIHLNDFIDLTAKIVTKNPINEILLVSNLYQNDSLIHWSAGSSQYSNSLPNQWFTIYHTISVRDIDVKKPFVLKAYLWNKDKTRFWLDNFTIRVRKENPILYSLTEKIR